MKCLKAIAVGTVVALAAAGAAAQEKTAAPATTPEQQAQMEAWARASLPRPEHQQLAYFAGNWTAKNQMWMDPKAPPLESVGSAKGEVIYGGRYVKLTYTGTAFGQPFTGEGLFGYDNLRGKFFNTWTDSLSTGFWLAFGEHDKAANAWTFKGEVPDPMKPGTFTKVREVFRIHDQNSYTFDYYETHDGKEGRTMTIEYRRQ
jgi:Protein of unknown function (DUF1579)